MEDQHRNELILLRRQERYLFPPLRRGKDRKLLITGSQEEAQRSRTSSRLRQRDTQDLALKKPSTDYI